MCFSGGWRDAQWGRNAAGQPPWGSIWHPVVAHLLRPPPPSPATLPPGASTRRSWPSTPDAPGRRPSMRTPLTADGVPGRVFALEPYVMLRLRHPSPLPSAVVACPRARCIRRAVAGSLDNWQRTALTDRVASMTASERGGLCGSGAAVWQGGSEAMGGTSGAQPDGGALGASEGAMHAYMQGCVLRYVRGQRAVVGTALAAWRRCGWPLSKQGKRPQPPSAWELAEVSAV